MPFSFIFKYILNVRVTEQLIVKNLFCEADGEGIQHY